MPVHRKRTAVGAQIIEMGDHPGPRHLGVREREVCDSHVDGQVGTADQPGTSVHELRLREEGEIEELFEFLSVHQDWEVVANRLVVEIVDGKVAFDEMAFRPEA